MYIRCPHCRDQIEVTSDESFSNVACPNCGSTFSLLGYALTDTQGGSGRKVAHFELLDRVGVGAFGVVWKARDTVLQRIVALKLPRHDELSPDQANYFFRDARAAAQVTHPGIVRVYEVGRDGETIYIASEFIEGATLADWAQSHPPSPREAAELLLKISEAVHHAHQCGIVHRDLKPSNILIDVQGQPHVTDFGLAKRNVGEVTVTIDGQVLGTPAYMSPEQARGEAHKADARTDNYSLGVILFQLITGQLPFEGSRAMLVVDIVHSDPPLPRSIRKSIPRDLESICLKCLEKNPERRYQTAKDFHDDLERFLRGLPVKARRPSIRDHVVRFVTRNQSGKVKSLAAFLAGLAAASMFVVVLGVAGIKYFDQEQPSASDSNPSSPKTRKIGSGALNDPAIAPFDVDDARQYQANFAEFHSVRVAYTNSLKMEFRLIPAGEFKRGTEDEDIERLKKEAKSQNFPEFFYRNADSEGPRHTVILSQPFYLCIHEVNQGQYSELMGNNPSYYSSTGRAKDSVEGRDTSRLPVENVSWLEAVQFCIALSRREGLDPVYRLDGEELKIVDGRGYRLPTEAEWEFACRAGTEEAYSIGNTEGELSTVGWYEANSGQQPKPVRQRSPNPFGLFDVHGNVWEWCVDGWDQNPYAKYRDKSPINPIEELKSETKGRVARGGSWGDPAPFLRSANRASLDYNSRGPRVGFRVALSLDAVKLKEQTAQQASGK